MFKQVQGLFSGRMVAALAAVLSFTATSAVARANYRRMPGASCRNVTSNVTAAGVGAGAITVNTSGSGGGYGAAVCPMINDTTIASNGATNIWVDFVDNSSTDWVRAQACVLPNPNSATDACAPYRYSVDGTGGSNTASGASTTTSGYLYIDRTSGSPADAGWYVEGYSSVYVVIPGYDVTSSAYSTLQGFYTSN